MGQCSRAGRRVNAPLLTDPSELHKEAIQRVLRVPGAPALKDAPLRHTCGSCDAHMVGGYQSGPPDACLLHHEWDICRSRASSVLAELRLARGYRRTSTDRLATEDQKRRQMPSER
ncbi:hypothetical protein ROHU_034055 [Labeo rohita]|uniref:Uncharacterized protein n=1 Tax=Labeo rohita TaxID=84645 RepID=A0A498LEW9_LABRO|nr:hypothetical protein ROHU_034055 [Labeo rohita]